MRQILPALVVAIVCLCGCRNTPPDASVPAIKAGICRVGTICEIGENQHEAVILDGYQDGKDSPLFRARVETTAQNLCGNQGKGMQVLNTRTEESAEGSGRWVMHMQFACSGAEPATPTAAQQLVANDHVRRSAQALAAQEVRNRVRDQMLAQRAADPVLQQALASQAIEAAKKFRFVVNFNSYCCGTDAAAATLFHTILADQQRTLGLTFKHQASSWGREGEYSECFALDELDAEAQHKFIETFKKRLQTERAYITQNTLCPRHPYSEIEEVYKILCARDKSYC
ncbi:MAG: hypothetical protein ACTS5I_17305 [Rhodanobacter sp.]